MIKLGMFLPPKPDRRWHLAARFELLEELKMNVLLRPDHAPTMYGENNDEPGYAALGRIFAIGYFKGVLDMIKKKQ